MSEGGKSRLAVFESTRWDFHLLTSMEIAFRAASDGQNVSYYFFEQASFPPYRGFLKWLPRLDGSLRVGKLFQHNSHKVLLRKFVEEIAARELDIKVRCVSKREWIGYGSPTIHIPKDIEDLRSLKILGRDAGTFLLSSVVSLTSNVNPEVYRLKRLIRGLVAMFEGVFIYSTKEFRLHSFDKVVVFNGRFAESGPFVLAAEEFGAEVLFHERGGIASPRFHVLGWQPHDVEKQGKAALTEWNSLSAREKAISEKRLSADVEKRRQGSGLVVPKTKTKRGSHGKIRQGRQKFLVFFTSTEGEFTSLRTREPESCFDSQLAAVLYLANVCDQIGLHLVVRIHPNVSKSSRAERQAWNQALKSLIPTHTVIPSNDKTSSYDLMHSAAIVCVWQSTIGVEAVWAGKPTISFSETAYEWAKADVVRVRRKDDLAMTLQSVEKKTVNKSSALPFLNYLLYGGEEFRYFDPNERCW